MTLALVLNLTTWRDVAEAARKLEGTLLSSAATQVFHTARVEPAITTTVNNLENRIQQWENRWNQNRGSQNSNRNQNNRGSQNRSPRCNTCQKNGHTTAICSETRCNQCNRKGHIA